MYTDMTELPFGRYKGQMLCNIPNHYLLAFYESNWNSEDVEHKQLIEYIERIKILLPTEYKRVIAPPNISHKVVGNFVQMVCNDTDKVIFTTEKDAKIEIRRMQKIEQEHKKPVRAYECDKCGGWHLTSISHEKKEKMGLG